MAKVLERQPQSVWWIFTRLPGKSLYFPILDLSRNLEYSKSPTYKPSCCEPSKMLMCIWFQKGTCAIGITCDWHQFALCLLLLMIFHLHHLPLPQSPVDSIPVAVCQLLYRLLYFPRGCKSKNASCLLLMYYLCEKYYKPMTVQYYTADGVSWVHRLTLLDLWTQSLECNLFICRGLTIPS